jgi:DNA-binding transcriptional LysR family regulator
LKEARAVLTTVEAAELALIEFSNLKRGVLSVQASQTIANYWLPRHLAAFRSAYPQIEIRARIGNTAQVAMAVENRETELGFVEAAIHSEQLSSTTVARDQIIVVTAPDHQLLERKPITLRDLMEVEWVLRERGCTATASRHQHTATGIFERGQGRLGKDARICSPGCDQARDRCSAWRGGT